MTPFTESNCRMTSARRALVSEIAAESCKLKHAATHSFFSQTCSGKQRACKEEAHLKLQNVLLSEQKGHRYVAGKNLQW